MSLITRYSLATQVQLMRNLQNKYFKAKKIATNSRRPADFEAAAAALLESKLQEGKVDQWVEDLVNAGEFPTLEDEHSEAGIIENLVYDLEWVDPNEMERCIAFLKSKYIIKRKTL